jgi:hypothetical protein
VILSQSHSLKMVLNRLLFGISLTLFRTDWTNYEKGTLWSLLWARKTSHGRSLVVSYLITSHVSSLRLWPNVGFMLLLNEPSKHSLNASLVALLPSRSDTLTHGGIFPSVLILHMSPCTEHQYVQCAWN